MGKSNRTEYLAGQILALARRDGLTAGDRLVEQRLADALGVSRAPVRAALGLLAERGQVRGERHRGRVLALDPTGATLTQVPALAGDDERIYRSLSDDRLDGRLGDSVTEAELLRRYDVTRAELLRVLDRIASEGWIERSRGYGWRFAEMLTSPAAIGRAAAFRIAIEPAALAEPGYGLEAAVIERLRTSQQRLLDGGLEALSNADLFQAGSTFHEDIIRGADNPFYTEALKRVNSIRRLYAYRTFLDRDGLRLHIREHLELLDLIADGRLPDASALMRRHLGRRLKTRPPANSEG